MPKVTLSFTLPEEHEEFDTAHRGAHYLGVLDELDNWLRAEIKYNDSLTDAQHDAFQQVRNKLWEFRNDE